HTGCWYNEPMRTVRACLAVAALGAAGGCLGDGGTVMLSADQQMGVTPKLTTFSANNATVNKDSLGFNHFTATSSMRTFTMLVLGDLTAGSMNDLAHEHDFPSFDLTVDGCSSNRGTLAIDVLHPTRLRLL